MGYQDHLGRVLVLLLGFITSLALAWLLHSPLKRVPHCSFFRVAKSYEKSTEGLPRTPWTGLGVTFGLYNIPRACFVYSLTFIASTPLFLFPCRKKATKKAPMCYQEHLGRVLVSLLAL
ncbi:MAG TPA: hypothetical protein DEA82_04265 [Flavobacteriaceae bacterium]|nr:hypothetical protein [Flavobacteriaceae bacterium]HBR53426.1 hypothetical protein [Flavobacteriaceae bacterium]